MSSTKNAKKPAPAKKQAKATSKLQQAKPAAAPEKTVVPPLGKASRSVGAFRGPPSTRTAPSDEILQAIVPDFRAGPFGGSTGEFGTGGTEGSMANGKRFGAASSMLAGVGAFVGRALAQKALDTAKASIVTDGLLLPDKESDPTEVASFIRDIAGRVWGDAGPNLGGATGSAARTALNKRIAGTTDKLMAMISDPARYSPEVIVATAAMMMDGWDYSQALGKVWSLEQEQESSVFPTTPNFEGQNIPAVHAAAVSSGRYQPVRTITHGSSELGPSTRVKGSQPLSMLQEVNGSTDLLVGISGGATIQNTDEYIELSPDLLNGRVAGLAKWFSRYRVRRFTVSYVPYVGTSTVGQFSFGINASGSLETQMTSTFSDIINFDAHAVSSFYQMATCSLDCPDTWFYNETLAGAEGEMLTAFGVLDVKNITVGTTGAQIYGLLVADYEFEFAQPSGDMGFTVSLDMQRAFGRNAWYELMTVCSKNPKAKKKLFELALSLGVTTEFKSGDFELTELKQALVDLGVALPPLLKRPPEYYLWLQDQDPYATKVKADEDHEWTKIEKEAANDRVANNLTNRPNRFADLRRGKG